MILPLPPAFPSQCGANYYRNPVGHCVPCPANKVSLQGSNNANWCHDRCDRAWYWMPYCDIDHDAEGGEEEDEGDDRVRHLKDGISCISQSGRRQLDDQVRVYLPRPGP